MSDFNDEAEDDGKPYRVIHGDCLPVMRALAIEPFRADCIVTDPPYHLTSVVKRFGGENAAPAAPGVYGRSSKGFMGKTWDGGDIAFQPDTWKYAGALLPPGGYLLAFGGTRNFHRLACAIEDAGFEIRDTLMWVYGSGFPKSHDVSKGIDKINGHKRGTSKDTRNGPNTNPISKGTGKFSGYPNTGISEIDSGPISPEATEWEGWGTALKPAWEPIIMARKPIEGTIAENVLKYGVGGINIDGCRVGLEGRQKHWDNYEPSAKIGYGKGEGERVGGAYNEKGRWPGNLCHDGSEEVEAAFGEFGERTSGGGDKRGGCQFFMGGDKRKEPTGHQPNTGSASRFFYSAKAGAADRAGSSHPTVKPLSLMRWLVRMVCPPGGTVLDPFAGSGTTLQAAILEGFKAVGIEKEAEYYADILRRLEGAQPAVPVREKWTAPADYDPAKLAAVRRRLGMAPLPTKTLTREEKEARLNALLEGKI